VFVVTLLLLFAPGTSCSRPHRYRDARGVVQSGRRVAVGINNDRVISFTVLGSALALSRRLMPRTIRPSIR
jgi:hypothetical protein